MNKIHKKMEWRRLLPRKRLGIENKKQNKRQSRSEWQRDFDRIIFSTAFRRLQDKTQVFPLSESDYPRTRLTHSLETSVVGRSLGIEVGYEIVKRSRFKEITPFDFGAIVASACLAHDIGNPPFGHEGENAIQSWFRNSENQFLENLSKNEKLDFLNFEGNAQGFRILSKLQRPNQNGGMQLTYATLGAFFKYPRESFNEKNKIKGVSSKKHGFFQKDKDVFLKIVQKLGLIEKNKNSAWYRHPLAFLIEAADDICYNIIDLEDGFLLKKIRYEDAYKYLQPLAKIQFSKSTTKSLDKQEKIEYMRAKAINNLIGAVVRSFIKKEKDILKGSFDQPLIETIKEYNDLERLGKYNKTKIYKSKDVVSIEMSGYEVIGRLLDLFVLAAFDLIKHGKKASSKSKKVAEFVLWDTDIHRGITNFEKYKKYNEYEALLKITDYISGMSDSFAVATYKKITGMTLPNR